MSDSETADTTQDKDEIIFISQIFSQLFIFFLQLLVFFFQLLVFFFQLLDSENDNTTQQVKNPKRVDTEITKHLREATERLREAIAAAESRN